MIHQTAAIFLDAYRLLNARKLFWISLIISALVVIAFALIGVTESSHVSVLGYETPIPLSALGWTAEDLYKALFVYFGINFWLAWLVTILALVTTAGMFPDFMAAGAIDLALSKPIGRWRLFLTKYAAGLLFVALQVTVFTGAVFLVLGLRAGAWEPSLFLAVPLVVVFFSYLFSVCTLLGVVTRSAIASLLLTLLIWVGFTAVNTLDGMLVMISEQSAVTVERLERREANLQGQLEIDERNGVERQVGEDGEVYLTPTEQRLASMQENLEDERADLASLNTWKRRVFLAKTALPKTSETIDLLRRWLTDLADLPVLEPGEGAVTVERDDDFNDEGRPRDGPGVGREAARRTNEVFNSRSAWWVLGSSLGFEAVMLLLAGWIFTRRDF